MARPPHGAAYERWTDRFPLSQALWRHAGKGPDPIPPNEPALRAAPGALEQASIGAERHARQLHAAGRQALSVGASEVPAVLGIARGAYGALNAMVGDPYQGGALKQEDNFAEGFKRGAMFVPGGLEVLDAAEQWGNRFKELGGPGYVRGAVDFGTPGPTEIFAGGVVPWALIGRGSEALAFQKARAKLGLHPLGGRDPNPRFNSGEALPPRAHRTEMDAKRVASQPTSPPATPSKSIVNPAIRTMDPADALAEARTGKHLKQAEDGQYIGGPRGVRTPDDIRAIRAEYDDWVRQGIAVGAPDWYHRARQTIRDIAGPDPAKQSIAARSSATMSAQASPETEYGFLVTGHNRVVEGQQVGKVRTPLQGEKLRRLHAGEDPHLGPKIGIYGENLDPTRPPSTVSTNDLFQGQAFRFTNSDGTPISRGFTAQEHSFLDAESILATERANAAHLGGRSDWTVPEIQAAAWVPLKARSLVKISKGKMSWEDALAAANKNQADYLVKHGAYVMHENIPYAKSGHLPSLLDADYATRGAWADDARQSWERGERDVLFDLGNTGYYHEPAARVVGQYTPPGGALEIGPANASRVQVALEPDDFAGRTIPQSTKDRLQRLSHVRGYVDVQGGVPYHLAMPEGHPGLKARGMGGLMLEHGPLDEQSMGSLSRVATEQGFGGDAGFLASRGESSVMNQFGPALKPKDVKRVRAALEEAGFTGHLRRARVEGDYASFESEFLARHAGKGKATRKLERELAGDPGLLDQLDASEGVRDVVRNKLDALRAAPDARADIVNALEIIAEKGFRALLEARKAGQVALPAALLPFLMIELESGGDVES